jgi:hypothetical protein
MAERILAQRESTSWRPAVCKKKIVCRCKNTRDRTPDRIGGETGEAGMPDFAADDGLPPATRPEAVLCRFLERQEKATSIFLYVGGVKISKKIW